MAQEKAQENPQIEKDMVNNPSHYGGKDNTYECILVLEAWGLDKDFCLGNCVKYISRAGKKNRDKEIEDLEKALWYLQRKIKNLKECAKNAKCPKI